MFVSLSRQDAAGSARPNGVRQSASSTAARAGTGAAGRPRRARLVALLATLLLLASLLPVTAAAPLAGGIAPRTALAAAPASVTLVGSLQSEAGCGGDWDPTCAATHMAYDAGDDVWQLTVALPAGSYEFKVALDDSWNENYGANAAPGGANIALTLAADASVKFYYDHKTHWITSNRTSRIAVAPGNFQSELGCPGDWDPGCLRSWLEDPDGDGVYTFETTALPAGSYEGKVALNESWDENYGQGGVAGGANIPFTVTASGQKVSFRFDSGTNTLTILAGHANDNNVEWDGLRHDSRSDVYRTPGGAVPAGTPVTIRFRTFHDDVSAVSLRLYDLNAGAAALVKMRRAAADVSCYQASLDAERCDFWQATLTNATPDNYWYRFVVTDGTSTAYYADDTTALDGGAGAPSANAIDNSWALMVHEPSFTAPAWAKDAVIYQIFPDRFRNGRTDNDPKTGQVRYDDPVLKLRWGILPEGYCRNYTDGATNCPWRFDPNPPPSSPTKESPRGRDYYGGDLKGVDQQLDYLVSLGVNTIYFNPIFDGGSNHGYDTQDYTRVDPYFGTQKDWDNLVKHANALGVRIILDGVFNHLSSDSPFFDRYHHYAAVGACESATSQWRSWFTFHDVTPGTGTCVDSQGRANAASYDGWFGFDSIPVLTKTNAQLQQYFLTAPASITRRWLAAGAAGWRLDVSGDPSFPAGYWETFRSVVKAAKPDALTISETWQKDSTLLRMLRGDRLDTTMNYRLRDAVLGFLTPGPFDSKGFGDSGRVITPAEFLSRLSSMREDYPDAAYYSLMNLLDSHDTERLLWTLTPGAETRADKEANAANVAAGKAAVRLASLIQFTVPGAPTVYYGDEVGITGDDDPDDRRTYPWADLGGTPDLALKAHYTALAQLRDTVPVLTDGDFRALLAVRNGDVAAYGRRTTSQAAIVVVNRGAAPETVSVPLAGYLRDGLAFTARFTLGTGGTAAATSLDGRVEVTVPARGALVLATDAVDLAPNAAPVASLGDLGNAQLSVTWAPVAGAASYDVWVSPFTGGGYVRANTSPVTGTAFTVSGLPNARTAYAVVTATDAAGNVSAWSNEVSGKPRLAIGWANLQWPPTLTHTISAVNRTDNVYGQVWIDGVTNLPGVAPSLRAQLGHGPDGSDPASAAGWTWIDASFNTNAGNNDEFVASLLPEATGTFDYAYRYTTTDGDSWVYADLDGIGNGYSPTQAGSLTVLSSGDTTAPATPANLAVTNASPAGVTLAWDANAGDATLYGYEVRRATSSGGPFETIATTTTAGYTDTVVDEGATYWYTVRAVDLSFNRSADSDPVSATAELRTVTLSFNVTVPATTDGTGRDVHIAGFLDRLDGNLPQWDPAGVTLTRADPTHWTITLTGKESTSIEYKYTLGSWDYVEKDASCGEIGNRQLTLTYGTTGVQTVNDTVPNWRNVAPCGN